MSLQVPDGVDLSWDVIIFLGALFSVAFLGAWRLFSMRNADHLKINNDLQKEVSEINKKIDKNKSELTEKMDSKFEATVNAIGRVESNAKEDYAVLHGRVNKNVEELGEVEGKVEYQRGVTDTMKEFLLSGKLK